MSNKRSSQRIALMVSGFLRYKEHQLPCRIENISKNGVLISLNDSLCDPICRGELWDLTFFPSGHARPITLATQVVHYGFALIGLKFINPDMIGVNLLEEIIGKMVCGTPPALPEFILGKGVAQC